MNSFLKALRLHQYVKNTLVFVPLFASHLYLNVSSVFSSVIAFVAFCLLASGVYVINDLVDIESDRQHRTKCHRPFAAGDLSIGVGVVMIVILILAAAALAISLSPHFLLVLVCYFLLSTAYSFYLKRKLLFDVFTLAVLYTVRIIAGIAAIHGQYSEWLITFSVFFFLSLAFLKRYSELFLLKKDSKSAAVGRGYIVDDLTQLSLFGTVSGYVSILVFAFYISSTQVAALYHHPEYLWLVCLCLLYWISRVWLLATRGLIHEDPVIFALRDRASFLVIAGIVFIMLMACL